MNPRNVYRTALGLFFLLLFGAAIAQQSQRSAEPKFVPGGSPGWRVTGENSLGAFSFSEIIVQLGTGPVPHRHTREDELWYILEGQLEFRLGERGERTIVAGPGDSVFGPRGVPHTFKAIGTVPARYVLVVAPAGFEKFLAERAALGKEIPTTDPSYGAKLKAIEQKYGLDYSSDWSFPPMPKN
jgi:mannose-6-phosphate isomerase-like protein (cupin superfamily)